MIEKIHINPDLVKTIHEHFDNLDDCEDALLLCTCVFLDNIEFLYRREFVKNYSDEQELFHKFRILFMQRDVDTDSLQAKYKLRYPLWVNEVEEDLFDMYYKALVMRFKTLPQSSRLIGNAKTKELFKALQMRHKDFDVQRMIDATINYYLKDDYLKNLDNFLEDLGDAKYIAWEKQKSKIL